MIKMVPKPSSRVRIGSDPLMIASQIGCDPESSLVELYMAKRRNPTIARGSSIFEPLTCSALSIGQNLLWISEREVTVK